MFIQKSSSQCLRISLILIQYKLYIYPDQQIPVQESLFFMVDHLFIFSIYVGYLLNLFEQIQESSWIFVFFWINSKFAIKGFYYFFKLPFEPISI